MEPDSSQVTSQKTRTMGRGRLLINNVKNHWCLSRKQSNYRNNRKQRVTVELERNIRIKLQTAPSFQMLTSAKRKILLESNSSIKFNTSIAGKVQVNGMLQVFLAKVLLQFLGRIKTKENAWSTWGKSFASCPTYSTKVTESCKQVGQGRKGWQEEWTKWTPKGSFIV